MNILVIGERERLVECEKKFGSGHDYTLGADIEGTGMDVGVYEVIFDFTIDQHPSRITAYSQTRGTVFLNATKITLLNLIEPLALPRLANFFGFNGLPTFLSAPLLEVAVADPGDRPHLAAICLKLSTEYTVVEDRVGLVTPRIIAMIINEAYHTVHEKTASREDVDLAMKLGTNYPYGPFEWCEKIGVNHIRELLEALFADTKDDRYRICPLLERESRQPISG